MPPLQSKEQMREEFDARWKKEIIEAETWGIDTGEIVDWFLSKIEQRERALVERLEGMKKDIPYMTPTKDVIEDIYYNNAIEDVIKLISQP